MLDVMCVYFVAEFEFWIFEQITADCVFKFFFTVAKQLSSVVSI